jgi:hypothetical protein
MNTSLTTLQDLNAAGQQLFEMEHVHTEAGLPYMHVCTPKRAVLE